jgi:hypothetical protein
MKNIEETSYKLKSGQEVRLPLRYKNWKWMMATFTAPVKQVKKILPSKIKPILVTPNKALISFGALQYPEVSDLEPYDEFLISIPVQYSPPINIPFLPLFFNPLFPQKVYKKGASYIYHLPVTTEESCKAGSEIWGFPKVVREMKFEENEKTKSCWLIDEGKEILSIEIEKTPVSKNKKDFIYCSYTEKDDQLLLTCIHANGNYGIKNMTGKASVKWGTGKITEELKKLSLSKRPIQVFFAEKLESALPLADESLPS